MENTDPPTPPIEEPLEVVPNDAPEQEPAPGKNPLSTILFSVLFFALGLGLGYLIWGSSIRFGLPVSANQQPGNQEAGAAVVANPQPTQELQIPEELPRLDVTIDEDDPIWGSKDAPITIVEFSDYECPFCEKWYQETLSPLMQEYPDQIRFVYKDFPLAGIHSEAVNAAVAANCAGEQDAYWAYHNALFDRKYGLGTDAYAQYASDLGLDEKAFAECMVEQRYKDEVMADYEYASGLGVQSTPTFFLNGIPIVGAQPYDFFKQVVDLELAGKLPKE
jgi:protein-disulfide isomerase